MKETKEINISENEDGESRQVEQIIISPIQHLPRCEHGNALSDWAGDWLCPSCGCSFDNASECNKKIMARLKLGL